MDTSTTFSYSKSISAGLAMRLASAADGFRDGKNYFFVCKLVNDDDEFDYDLTPSIGVDDANISDASADADNIIMDKPDNGASYFKFGPYKTEPEPEEIFEDTLLEIKLRDNTKAAETGFVFPPNTGTIYRQWPDFVKLGLPYLLSRYARSISDRTVLTQRALDFFRQNGYIRHQQDTSFPGITSKV